MTDTTPQVRHVYRHHHLDSTRWEQFTPRAVARELTPDCARWLEHGWLTQ